MYIGLIEWTDSSLCIPKKIAGSMVILAVDVDDIICSGHTKLNDKLDQVCVLLIHVTFYQAGTINCRLEH